MSLQRVQSKALIFAGRPCVEPLIYKKTKGPNYIIVTQFDNHSNCITIYYVLEFDFDVVSY